MTCGFREQISGVYQLGVNSKGLLHTAELVFQGRWALVVWNDITAQYFREPLPSPRAFQRPCTDGRGHLQAVSSAAVLRSLLPGHEFTAGDTHIAQTGVEAQSADRVREQASAYVCSQQQAVQCSGFGSVSE